MGTISYTVYYTPFKWISAIYGAAAQLVTTSAVIPATLKRSAGRKRWLGVVLLGAPELKASC